MRLFNTQSHPLLSGRSTSHPPKLSLATICEYSKYRGPSEYSPPTSLSYRTRTHVPFCTANDSNQSGNLAYQLSCVLAKVLRRILQPFGPDQKDQKNNWTRSFTSCTKQDEWDTVACYCSLSGPDCLLYSAHLWPSHILQGKDTGDIT